MYYEIGTNYIVKGWNSGKYYTLSSFEDRTCVYNMQGVNIINFKKEKVIKGFEYIRKI